MGCAHARPFLAALRGHRRRNGHSLPALRPWGTALALGLLLGPSLAVAADQPSLVDRLELPGTDLWSPPGLPPRDHDLVLVWYDPYRSLTSGFPVLAEEVEAIFGGLGVRVAWKVGGEYGDGPVPEIPVILLLRDPLLRRKADRVMGLVRRDEEPSRAVWIFGATIRATLAETPEPGLADPVGSVAFARAIARVAAHEVVHALSPDEPHAKSGLMRHALDGRFLLGDRVTIDPRCAAAFLASLAERRGRTTRAAPSSARVQVP
jgi:hypothetical protein